MTLVDKFDKLSSATKILYEPGGTSLRVKGKFTATLSKDNNSTQEEVYVVEGLRTPLLGGVAAMTLQMVARLNNISLDTTETVKREFSKFFSGLGKMEFQYTIVLKPREKPFPLSTPHCISLTLLFAKGKRRADFKGGEACRWRSLCTHGGGTQAHRKSQNLHGSHRAGQVSDEEKASFAFS